ncbi:hypothetical protein [Erysipelothrix aquatica]|uniref:hypothetical protein n=1 Tax=Erysipelothrix aquatica TaxID=2683714 RepID=UPI001356A81C|nr:hypothetical protein [Erysipelothrix aquatica]
MNYTDVVEHERKIGKPLGILLEDQLYFKKGTVGTFQTSQMTIPEDEWILFTPIAIDVDKSKDYYEELMGAEVIRYAGQLEERGRGNDLKY